MIRRAAASTASALMPGRTARQAALLEHDLQVQHGVAGGVHVRGRGGLAVEHVEGRLAEVDVQHVEHEEFGGYEGGEVPVEVPAPPLSTRQQTPGGPAPRGFVVRRRPAE